MVPVRDLACDLNCMANINNTTASMPVLQIRIRMFLGLLDPDQAPDPDPSIIKQKSKKNLNIYCLWHLSDFLSSVGDPAVVFFFNFWSLKPWIRIGSGSGSVFSLKCWIWIQMKWIRIRNPVHTTDKKKYKFLPINVNWRQLLMSIHPFCFHMEFN